MHFTTERRMVNVGLHSGARPRILARTSLALVKRRHSGRSRMSGAGDVAIMWLSLLHAGSRRRTNQVNRIEPDGGRSSSTPEQIEQGLRVILGL